MNPISDAAIRRLQSAATWPDFGGSRYSVVREIGRGGMGTVYLGRDEELGREVAIKVTSAALAGGALEQRMRREARILAGLEHPGIVPIHDVGALSDGRLFTVMKLVRGVTLGDHLAGLADRDERLRLFERLCEPVAFAHARGTVHRDLKPANVMVGAFGEVLVMDWGIAKANGEDGEGGEGGEEGNRTAVPELETDPGTVMGTAGYMAPEQRAGAEVDARADVHALGAILFVLLSGGTEPPDPGADVGALLRQRGVPVRLRAICARAMAADRDARYAGAQELAADVACFRLGQPVSAYPETVLDRMARLVSRHRTPILLITAYLVVRAVIAIVFGR